MAYSTQTRRESQPQTWLVIKPDGNYLTSTKTQGDARKVANDYAKVYGRHGWRFVQADQVAKGLSE
jgi:hypothetical protein